MNSLRRIRPLLMVALVVGLLAPTAEAVRLRVRPGGKRPWLRELGIKPTPWYGVRRRSTTLRQGSFDGGHRGALEGRAQSEVRFEAARQGLRAGEPRYNPRYHQRDGSIGRLTDEGFEYPAVPVRSATGLRQGTLSTRVRRDGAVVSTTDLVDYRPAAAFGTATLGVGAAASGYLLLRDDPEPAPKGPYGLDP